MSEFAELAAACNNWGKWGDSDELGTLNYIDASKRARAATLVQKGAVFTLSIPLAPNIPAPRGRPRLVHLMFADGTADERSVQLKGGACGVDDFIAMPLHYGTHWDSLAHIYYDRRLYNGYPAETADGRGASKNGLDKAQSKFVSRGVLLDVPRARGVPMLEPGYAITNDDLDAAERLAGIHVEQGDIVVVRTGVMSLYAETGRWDKYRSYDRLPGLDWRTVTWLHERRVAAIAADNGGVEASGSMPGYAIPLHMIAIRDMGMPLGEYWYLEDLAADCAEDGRYEFLLVAPALNITRAAGSQVNPVALK